MNLAPPPSVGKVLPWVLRNPGSARDYFQAVYELSRFGFSIRLNGRTRKYVVTYTGRGAELASDLGTIQGGGDVTIQHPFQLEDVSDSVAKVKVRYGTMMDVVPTSVATTITLTNSATNYLYLKTEVSTPGLFVGCILVTSTSAQPTDTDVYGYITLGTAVVAGNAITTLNQAVTHSLRMAVCGRIVDGETITETGTYEFWGV